MNETDHVGQGEYRVVLKKGRRWMHLRIEALKDNAPRYQVRRAKFDMTDPDWAFLMAGFIVGFMGAPTEGVGGSDS